MKMLNYIFSLVFILINLQLYSMEDLTDVVPAEYDQQGGQRIIKLLDLTNCDKVSTILDEGLTQGDKSDSKHPLLKKSQMNFNHQSDLRSARKRVANILKNNSDEDFKNKPQYYKMLSSYIILELNKELKTSEKKYKVSSLKKWIGLIGTSLTAIGEFVALMYTSFAPSTANPNSTLL